MKRYSSEQVVEKLRQADVELGKGLSVPEVCRAIEVTEQPIGRFTFPTPGTRTSPRRAVGRRR
jgi:hypothetical protein